MNKFKITFLIVWFLLLLLAPITVFENTSITSLTKSPPVFLNIIQRIIGLLAFTLLFVQIILGSFMSRLVDKLGGWVFSFHIFQGILIYILIILHPSIFVVFNYFVKGGIDPFYVFTDICLLCNNSKEFFYSLGRISFWLITVSVLAGLFRTATPWLRTNWKKLHVLNYVSFILIYLHSIGEGTDIGTPPFTFFHGPAMIIVSIIILSKLIKFVKSILKH